MPEHVPAEFAAQLAIDPALVGKVPDRVRTGGSIIDDGSVLEDNGRTYQGYRQGKYLLPNDVEEQDRLDLQHALLVLAMDGELAWAPIDEPSHVLDIATGTGIWALEFAEQHPMSAVIGTDLSMVQPPEEMHGIANCSFVRLDADEDAWGFDHRFDYIHLRMTFTCFDNRKSVIARCLESLNPGGWIEFQDYLCEVFSPDNTHEGSVLQMYCQKVISGCAAMGRDALDVKHYKELLHEAGFVDIVEKQVPIPTGAWPSDPRLKKIGKYALENATRGMSDGTFSKLLLASGLGLDDAKNLAAWALQEIQNPDSHVYCPLYVVYARKPFEKDPDVEISTDA